MNKSLSEIDAILIDFEKDYWVAPTTRKGKTRHILLHMTKLLGKLGTVVEKWEHGLEIDEKVIAEEIVPDLLIYALMLARDENIDLEKVFIERLEVNKKKVGGWKKGDLLKDLPQL
jgi:NTP pyrophosphatase (non-canonical NTP hydrolase)